MHAFRRHSLASFVALAYAISWAWTFPLLLAGVVVEKGAGWPTHLPALLGPAVAALAVTALACGRAGVRELLGRVVRWRMPLRWWAATLSPLAFLGVALGIAMAAGTLPSASGFGRFSGIPTIGVVPVAVIAILITFGEETGWRGFRATFGEPPHRYLQRRRAERAMELLRETQCPVTEICFQVGFKSLGTFSRTFRGLVGEPPSAYRARFRDAGAALRVPACWAMAWMRPAG